MNTFRPAEETQFDQGKDGNKQTNMKTEQAWNGLYPVSAAYSVFTIPYFVEEYKIPLC